MSVQEKKSYVLRVDERTCMHKSVQIQAVFELMCVMCAGKVRHNGLSGKRASHGHAAVEHSCAGRRTSSACRDANSTTETAKCKRSVLNRRNAAEASSLKSFLLMQANVFM